MEDKKLDVLSIENAHIMFRNFTGREGKYNKAGIRSFSVSIDDVDLAEKLAEEGWNVRILPAREEGEQPRHYLQVAVNFENIPPKVLMITRKKKVALDEEGVAALDYADLSNVNLVIRPYQWEVNGKTGVKAYLKTGYFTVEEDEFADRYDDIPFEE